MNTVLWIIQILLALLFLMAGVMKLTQSREKLAQQMKWVEGFSPTIIKAIGLVEILGAVGLILPGLTHILPILTALAAAGLALDMLGAIATHARRSEVQMIVVNVVLLALAVFVVYGRFIAVPLT